ncbi:mycofactocin biosynthesis glycosyltransferase MftF [Gordonia sp. HY285]|uniref:mycofactocin biosynthesis glycosyltransferase MftF n=1 Tax=Gordonia liuliyuniae TaxID=2911517 RepID=UPI001EED9C0C|nr:mycofactocin biosynthesis glycosyltransferase MftF [Gordonia liuliyuniae]MCF8609794.1 mycofactocin biosynthesis glycosyltransferase MftF [Gordonia liuliyuniae]
MNAGTAGPATTSLPAGFQVQIDPRCARGGNLRHLVGGSPLRVMKLSDPALGMTSGDGRIAVHDTGTQILARRLLDAGIAHPRPMSGPDVSDVTVVIPVHGNQAGIDRLLSALGDVEVIVVDDASDEPIRVPAGVRSIRFDDNQGPAAARNAGTAAADTEFVAFLDSDTVPESGWLTMLLGHFADPAVAIVAPRIVGLGMVCSGAQQPDSSAVAEYANRFSSLDMGPREALVAPGSPIAYVPSAAMVIRRDAFLGFDESLRVAEDVDLCWRTHEHGWRIRYDPIASVGHDHRETLRAMLNRRRFYGTGGAELALRHGALAAPVVTTVPLAAAVIGLMMRSRWGALVAAVILAFVYRRTRRLLGDVPRARAIAAQNTARAVGFGLLQACAAVLRHYWPVSLLAFACSRRFRRWLPWVAVAEAVAMWVRCQLVDPEAPVMSPLHYAAYRRLDDLAYGAGLWQGALKRRDVGALRPVISR